MPHLWPTGSSSGWPPSITARYFSSCPSDPTSRWTPCPPGSLNGGFRSALSVSGFRLRAHVGFSIPSILFGRRDNTPAFGYDAPHSSVRGTSTLLNNALLSAQYEPLRHPTAPGPSLTGVRLFDPSNTPWGFPCCVRFPCVHAAATTPAQRLGSSSAQSPKSYQPSPKGLPGRSAHRPFRGLLGVHSRCGLHTRAVTVNRDKHFPKASTVSLPPQLLR